MQSNRVCAHASYNKIRRHYAKDNIIPLPVLHRYDSKGADKLRIHLLAGQRYALGSYVGDLGRCVADGRECDVP